MTRTLIVPELRNKVRKAERQMAKLRGRYDTVCLLGDYFDDFNDTPAHAERVARWMRRSLDRPGRIHLLGNYDLGYLVPQRVTACSGVTDEKREAIAKILHEMLLERFSVAVEIDGWLGYARGGRQDVGGITWPDFDREFVATPGLHQIVGHTPARPIRARVIFDGRSEMLRFVQGNTEASRIERRNYKSVNWCLDTHLRSLALVDGESIQFFWV